MASRALTETRPVQLPPKERTARANSERRWSATFSKTKSESPRGRLAAAREHHSMLSTAAAAAAAIATLEWEENTAGEVAPNKRRADTRAATEPHPQFARGTVSSQSDTDDTAPLERELPSVVIEPQERATSSFETEIRESRWDPERASSTGTQLENFHPSRSSWLGVVVSQPDVGARVVIGSYTSQEFIVTSPVAKIIERPDGVFVETTSNNRYFVAPGGDAFLVRRVG